MRTWVRVALVLVALTLSSCSGGLSQTDTEQSRLDTPAPRIETSDAVAQSFVSHAVGLSAIELVLAVYPDPPPPGALTLRLLDETGVELARQDFPLRDLQHNAPLRFEFAPQRDSPGRVYRLSLSGPPRNPATVWSTRDAAYPEGQLFERGQPIPGALNFKTQAMLGYIDIIAIVLAGAVRDIWLALPLVGAFVVPGLALVRWLSRGRRPLSNGDYHALADPVGRLALAIGLSLAVWPIAFLLLSVTSIRLSAPVVWLVVLALAGLVFVDEIRHSALSLRAWWSPDHRLVVGVFLSVLLLTAGLRALHILGLAVSPWVDSIQHAVGVDLFVDGGRLPSTWGPAVLDSPFYYHFGFHAATAVFIWLSGRPTHEALLFVGQVVNTLVAVGAYLLTARLTGRRGAGLVALAIVGTVTLMPSYYLTWGRYTQLFGLAMLPAAAVLAFDAVNGRLPLVKRIALAGLMGGALFVTHYRVLLMYAALVAAYTLVEIVTAVFGRRMFLPPLGRAASVAGVALLLTLPWTARLALTTLNTGTLGAWFSAPATFNTPHWELLALRFDTPLVALSALGALLSPLGMLLRELGVPIKIWTRPHLVAIVGLATLLSVLATNPGVLGLRNSWIFTNDSLIITAFLPVALMSGYALAALHEAVASLVAPRVQVALNGLAGLALVVGGLWASDGLLTVVNPVTILATREDVQAATWIRQHTPPDARFLVNARPWQEGVYAASDGGGWLPVLADRAVTLPPVSYSYASSTVLLERVNRTAGVVATAPNADALVPIIAAESVTHVYIGAKGGALKSDMFLGRPDFRLVYTNGPVTIFEVVRR